MTARHLNSQMTDSQLRQYFATALFGKRETVELRLLRDSAKGVSIRTSRNTTRRSASHTR